ncbi:MAG: PIN domain-containing protein [Chromatiales bacterium]|jgi:predicted nucleic acid-binding protein|nr:PIN domain-containing protein [Chromatiales bacterium]
MSADLFLDTNIFIYQLDESDRRKSLIADKVIREAVQTGNACISSQVVQECLNTVLRKAEVPLDVASARAYLDHILSPLLQVTASVDLYHRGLDVQDRYRYSFYDSMIIVAALEAGCSRLLTEDLQHGQTIGPLTIENPFG